MKILSRSLLSAAALSAVLAPSLFAELSGTGANLRQVIDTGDCVLGAGTGAHTTQLLPVGFGSGLGVWTPPTEVNGFVTAKLYDPKGKERYALRATLVYYIPENGDTTDVHGGIFGELLARDPKGAKVKVADVQGAWVRRPDGSGDFSATIVAHRADGTDVSIGHMSGELRAPAWIPATHLQPLRQADRARLTMNWSISE